MFDKGKKAQLILENGVRFDGNLIGYTGSTVGEVVFNTAMTGYQELLTDPSYSGQIVVMTYPLIGNYGINLDDMESDFPRLKGFIVRELCDLPNNWRCELELNTYLEENKIVGMQGVDTRALTKLLRTGGTMRGIITPDYDSLTDENIKTYFDNFSMKNVIQEATVKEKYVINGSGKHVAFLDLGTKKGILRDLKKRGCKITVFPAFTAAEEILAENPDLVFISNGPGDPKDVPFIIETAKNIIGKKPLVGICMGHQIISLALGGNTNKMKFGHHGGNHPVRNEQTGRVYITSQNHEYVVCDLPDSVETAYVNINDGTIEGIRHKTLPVMSVQFHPEASPGPLDSGFLFDEFLKIADKGVE